MPHQTRDRSASDQNQPDQSQDPISEQRTDDSSPAARLEEVADNAGARTAAIHADPTLSLEAARNAAAGEGPNSAGSTSPDDSENYVPSTSDPEASDLPSAR